MKTTSNHIRISCFTLCALCFTLFSATDNVEPGATNILFQSKDGGLTWQDVSESLPVNQQPEGFFAGETDVYLRVKDVLYRSKSNLSVPVWEKENVLDHRSASIVFNRSGIMAFNYDGEVYQKVSPQTWLPRYTDFEKHSVRTIFESANGAIFLGSDYGIFKSADCGRNWKTVQNEGVMDIVESEGVLVATGPKGIMRSTDNGEHWQWVISEGGVGIAVEKIDGGFATISYSGVTGARRIHLSFDKGNTWKSIEEGLPSSMSISSIKQVGKYLLCGHPDGIFRSADMGKTWNLVHTIVDQKVVKFGNTWSISDFTVDTKVLKLFVSGNILYAVARDTGC